MKFKYEKNLLKKDKSKKSGLRLQMICKSIRKSFTHKIPLSTVGRRLFTTSQFRQV